MQEDTNRHDPASLRIARGPQRKFGNRGAAMAALLALAVVLVGCGGGDDDAELAAPSGSAVQPLALPGPYAIACSNVAQDFARAPAGGEAAKDYWEGKPAADGTATLRDRPAQRSGEYAVAHRQRAERQQPVRFLRRQAGRLCRDRLLSDHGRQPPAGLCAAHGPACAAHADRCAGALVRRRLHPLSDACVFARPRRQPAVGRPLRRAFVAGEPWLCRGGAISRRPAFHEPADRRFRRCRGRADESERCHRHAGLAPAGGVCSAGPAAGPSAMARPCRCHADRWFRCEPGRRDHAAVGRCRADDLARPVVDTGRRRSAPEGGGGLRALFRASAAAGLRARPARPRRRHLAVPGHRLARRTPPRRWPSRSRASRGLRGRASWLR